MKKERSQSENLIKKSARRIHGTIISPNTPVVLSGLNLITGLSKLLEGDLSKAGIAGIGALAAGTAVAIEKGKKSNRKKRSEL